MAAKKLAGLKMLVIICAVLLGFLVIAKWNAGADTSKSYKATVAQNETQPATDEKNAPAPTSKEPEAKTDEKKESTAAKKKPLKDFQPSEKIEAEQAVDFPYDI